MARTRPNLHRQDPLEDSSAGASATAARYIPRSTTSLSIRSLFRLVTLHILSVSLSWPRMVYDLVVC
ncbi:uncharacterized protein BDW43DRAFT_49313 [Aspergillus alliaceus]|uniref:uncharacterized protein n=1 Tax=Petromyces alliaceus TaxID=209559 RepID=UPI0012A73DF8|nr:uncharacterized protein BDW43DRAFT_49313 [Aspergillus alliaceus]KAB8235032.1 hypothetical protein BDW43DRAFT_49313 [Aspergillus alliaceus]